MGGRVWLRRWLRKQLVRTRLVSAQLTRATTHHESHPSAKPSRLHPGSGVCDEAAAARPPLGSHQAGSRRLGSSGRREEGSRRRGSCQEGRREGLEEVIWGGGVIWKGGRGCRLGVFECGRRPGFGGPAVCVAWWVGGVRESAHA